MPDSGERKVVADEADKAPMSFQRPRFTLIYAKERSKTHRRDERRS